MDVERVVLTSSVAAVACPSRCGSSDANKPRFYQSEPPRELGSQTAIRQELTRLTRAGLLDEERPDGENRVYYVRTGSAWWRVIELAADLLDNKAVPPDRG